MLRVLFLPYPCPKVQPQSRPRPRQPRHHLQRLLPHQQQKRLNQLRRQILVKTKPHRFPPRPRFLRRRHQLQQRRNIRLI